MADADLEEIRRARLKQLQAQRGSRESRPDEQAGEEAEQQRQREADARQTMLHQILEPDAADRLGRIRLVKEQRAQDVENRLIMLARNGQLSRKVNEEQLKDILNAVSNQVHEQQEKVVVKRTKGTWDDDDDDLLDL